MPCAVVTYIMSTILNIKKRPKTVMISLLHAKLASFLASGVSDDWSMAARHHHYTKLSTA